MTSEQRQELIKDIKRYRRQKVITLQQLADKYGVTIGYVHQLKSKLASVSNA